jgi:hypothetical protein
MRQTVMKLLTLMIRFLHPDLLNDWMKHSLKLRYRMMVISS